MLLPHLVRWGLPHHLHRQTGLSPEKIYDFHRTYRLHIICINPHIIPQNSICTVFNIVIFMVVLMTMKCNRTLPITVPLEDRIMKQYKALIQISDFHIIPDGTE